MMKNFLKFLKAIEDSKCGSVLLLKCEEAFFEKLLAQKLKELAFDLKNINLPKGGPDSEAQEACQGALSLFSSKSVVWFKGLAALSNWKKDAWARWESMCGVADPTQMLIILSAPLDKRMKWADLNAEEYEFKLESEADKKEAIEYIARQEEFELNPRKLQFLMDLNVSLLEIENYLKLWVLGGDLWAEKTLGWGLGQNRLSLAPGENPAYLWVDSVLNKDIKRATLLAQTLIEEGSEPLSLMALLSKSVRILSSLEQGQSTKGMQPPFLVQKLKPLADKHIRQKTYWGTRLLKKVASLDVKLKSSSTSPEAALLNILSA